MDRNLMIHLLKLLLKEELTEKTMILAFREAEILTGNEGLVVRLTNGDEFQITVAQSKIVRTAEQDVNDKLSYSRTEKGEMN